LDRRDTPPAPPLWYAVNRHRVQRRRMKTVRQKHVRLTKRPPERIQRLRRAAMSVSSNARVPDALQQSQKQGQLLIRRKKQRRG
jgi:hypothetical protein